ncbi:AAA family ATPase [Streptacidiphilus sp. EB103A]|uniref:ATP-binding protein n=1 Tax=Streptacidiphilus sp. EB103A TaxID=3156275 RepID=UPI0035198B90
MLLKRQPELDLATAAMRAAQAGHGSLLVITGPLGIGRSTLLDAVAGIGAAHDVLVLRASAALTERGFALGVVRQLLESALRRVTPETAKSWTSGSAHDALSALEDELPSGNGEAHGDLDPTVLLGLQSLLANICSDQAVLLLIDDLHWADPASLRLLGQLSRQLRQLRVLLVCTVREGDELSEDRPVREVTANAALTLFPGALDPDDVGTLLRRHFGTAPDEEFVLACHRTTRGNPMFLAALLAETDRHDVRPTAANAALAAALRPTLLRQRLRLCLEWQSERVRRVAHALTILVGNADLHLVGQLAGLDQVERDEALRLLQRLGLLTEDRPPRFVHPIVQEALEEALLTTERDRLHTAAAALLHSGGHPAEQVARQLLAITTKQDAWATDILRAAADTALRRGAPVTAASYLRRALLDCSSHDSRRAGLLVDLATAERGFSSSVSIRHVSQALPLLNSVRERAAAVTRLGPIALGLSLLPVEELLRDVADGLGPVEKLQEADRELALSLEARIRYVSARDPAALASAVRRFRALGPEPGMESVAERELLMTLLFAATITIDLPAAEVAPLAHAILAREPALPGHVHTPIPLVLTALIAADSVQGLTGWLGIAHRHSAHHEPGPEQTLVMVEQARVHLACGQLSEARSRALTAFELAAGDEGEVAVLSARALATVALQTRDATLCDRLLGAPWAAPEDSCLSVSLAMLRAATAAHRGDLHAALEHSLGIGHRLEQRGWRNPALVPWASGAALVCLRLGDRDRADELSLLELERTREWGAPAALGRSLSARGKVVDGSAGVDLLHEAVEVLETSADRFELSRALLALGERSLPTMPEDAQDALWRAHRIATECGAEWVAARARARLGKQASPPPVRADLTSAERKVAEFAASGLTNQAIADELGVSRRAVEKHLTHCYRKLAVDGRAALTAALHAASSVPAAR